MVQERIRVQISQVGFLTRSWSVKKKLILHSKNWKFPHVWHFSFFILSSILTFSNFLTCTNPKKNYLRKKTWIENFSKNLSFIIKMLIAKVFLGLRTLSICVSIDENTLRPSICWWSRWRRLRRRRFVREGGVYLKMVISSSVKKKRWNYFTTNFY